MVLYFTLTQTYLPPKFKPSVLSSIPSIFKLRFSTCHCMNQWILSTFIRLLKKSCISQLTTWRPQISITSWTWSSSIWVSSSYLPFTVFNQCLRLNYFPSSWNLAKVILIRKPGSILRLREKTVGPSALLKRFSKNAIDPLANKTTTCSRNNLEYFAGIKSWSHSVEGLPMHTTLSRVFPRAESSVPCYSICSPPTSQHAVFVRTRYLHN